MDVERDSYLCLQRGLERNSNAYREKRHSYTSERTVKVTPMSTERRVVEKDTPTLQREQWR